MPKKSAEKKQGTDLRVYWMHKRQLNKLAAEYTQNMDRDGVQGVREKLQSGNIKVLPTICISRKIGVGALFHF